MAQGRRWSEVSVLVPRASAKRRWPQRSITLTEVFSGAFAVPGQCPVSARSVPGDSARFAIAEDSANE